MTNKNNMKLQISLQRSEFFFNLLPFTAFLLTQAMNDFCHARTRPPLLWRNAFPPPRMPWLYQATHMLTDWGTTDWRTVPSDFLTGRNFNDNVSTILEIKPYYVVLNVMTIIYRHTILYSNTLFYYNTQEALNLLETRILKRRQKVTFQ